MKKAELPLLSLRGIVRDHGEGAHRVRALGPIDLDVFGGEFVSIMGPSGSGKSTLLSLAGALDVPTSGQILLAGSDLASFDARATAQLRRRTIGFVFQSLNLLPGLTALENVALPLELDGANLRRARRSAAEELERVGLANLADRFPEQLSGGERQRVAIARAFVGERRLLLADEPTGALDTLTGEGVMRLLRQHCDEGRTVVLVTHDPAHAAWADRVVRLKDGLVVDTTPAGETSRNEGSVVSQSASRITGGSQRASDAR